MDITLYTIGCPQCLVLEAKLNAAKIKYTIVDDEDIIDQKGYIYLPVLEINGQPHNFQESLQWLKKENFNGN